MRVFIYRSVRLGLPTCLLVWKSESVYWRCRYVRCNTKSKRFDVLAKSLKYFFPDVFVHACYLEKLRGLWDWYKSAEGREGVNHVMAIRRDIAALLPRNLDLHDRSFWNQCHERMWWNPCAMTFCISHEDCVLLTALESPASCYTSPVKPKIEIWIFVLVLPAS